MRRSDREITDFGKIVEIIGRCDVLRLGLCDGGLPYIVPVNFGFTAADGVIKFYIHGAKAGRKYELLKRYGVCSFEADNLIAVVCRKIKRNATARYESVMGTAEARFLEGEEKSRAIDEYIMARYPETREFDYDRSAVERTAVIELTVKEITAKANKAEDKV